MNRLPMWGAGYAVVRIAEVVDGDPDREGERQRDAGEGPGRENLPITASISVTGSVISSSAPLLLLCPQTHGDRRHEERYNHGWKKKGCRSAWPRS